MAGFAGGEKTPRSAAGVNRDYSSFL